ncbi:hypothetical protein FOVG_18384 [Fusarium oxysporum f. sp. pisi HDV247]|uniref:Uncharacterized protein n=1 Tax=Fusarium oxysporum f. sp. pisi HDV247 TaxID=1080344 RepID=W9NHK3_FUSOX|nr:hypothetical protein FOVG_18384 [Fusarium oxysporum f. sp. pisi HDV247]
MRYYAILAFTLVNIAVAQEAPHKTDRGSVEKSHTMDSTSPTITALPHGNAERDLDSLLSSLELLASKASGKGSSLLDHGETLIKDKASAISTAFDGSETLISDKIEEVNSRVLSAMKEVVTHLNEGSDSGDGSGNSAASVDVQRSVAAAVAVLGAIFIGFVAA